MFSGEQFRKNDPLHRATVWIFGSLMQDRRVLIPISAAVIIAAVCSWRIASNRPQDYAEQLSEAIMMRPAPVFEVLDSDNHLIRLASYLGRHQILVLFFDGEAGADQDAELLRLRERFPELQKAGVKVIAVSAALPQQNRASIDKVGPFPFPLVCDIDPLSPAGVLRIHRQWGRLSESGTPLVGVFLVDRKGQIRSTPNGPLPLENVDRAVDEAVHSL